MKNCRTLLICALLSIIICFSACAKENQNADPGKDGGVTTSSTDGKTDSDGSSEEESATGSQKKKKDKDKEESTTGSNDKKETGTKSGSEKGFEIAEGLYVTDVFSYSGPYLEDGSNEECKKICAVRLFNSSEKHYQYLKFELETKGGTYTFTASTLFAGAEMTVLSEGRAAFKRGKPISANVLAVIEFTETPSVHTDTLEITYTDGFINVKNLTNGTLKNVYVYFKETDKNGYLGGITYRTRLGDIPAGEIVQARAANIHNETSRIVFADYSS